MFGASPPELSSQFRGVFSHQPLEQGPLNRLNFPSVSVGQSFRRGDLELTPASSHIWIKAFSVDKYPPLFLLPRFNILVDGYNSLDRNINSLFSTIPSP